MCVDGELRENHSKKLGLILDNYANPRLRLGYA